MTTTSSKKISTSSAKPGCFHSFFFPISNEISRQQFPPSSTPSTGFGGASEAGAAGGGARAEGGPQEDAGHPAAAVGPGAADVAL